MIDELKAYPAYRESDHEWLGPVPEQWDILRAKYLFREVDERSTTGKEELLSVSHLTGVTPRSQKIITMFLAKSNIGHKVCRPDDLVINTMWAWMGALGVTRHTGIVSPAYGVYRPVTNARIHPRYADLLLRNPVYSAEYWRRSTGVNSSRLRLYPEQFLRITLVVPPFDEQLAIVRFLGSVNGRLERAIRAKRKVIALLNEQKQAIIHRAVTRGLDPSVPLKPSGIPWLGAVPENYQRTKLGRVCISVRDGTHNPPPALPGVHRLLSVRNVINGNFVVRPDDRTMTASAFAELQRSYTVESGDVVIAIVGATTGKSAVVGELDNVTVQRSLAILRPKKTLITSAFLNLLVSSEVIQGQIRQVMDKYAAQPGIYLGELAGLQVVYPTIEEQKGIVLHVAHATTPINDATSRLEREIELLREYRTRLIADVVTGKLDVRGIELPESTDDLWGLPIDVVDTDGSEDALETDELTPSEIEA
jgi:type I restriction enzyme, S subunit